MYLSYGSNLGVRNNLILDNSEVRTDRIVLSPGANIKLKNSKIILGSSGDSNPGNSLIYDENGNLISGLGLTFEYNDANQLAKVKEGANTIAEYSYDFTGQRFRKVAGGVTTYYIGKDFETGISGQSVTNTAYYYANGELLSRKDPDGKRYYYHNDHLTGTNVVTDSAGNLVGRTRYKPFGGLIEGGLSRNLFTGQEFDKETGIYYYSARYYNPTLMRFTQADPVIQNFYDPQNLNSYSYTLNNPVKYTDTTGNIVQIPSAVLMYISALVSTPDFSMDAAFIMQSALSGDYEGAGYGAVGLAIPGVLAAETGIAGKLVRKG